MDEYVDDQELVSNELLQMQNESYWLIQREVPTVCKRVRTIVNKCLELLHPIDAKNNEESEDKTNNSNNNNNSNNEIQEEDNEVNEIFDILKFNEEDLKKVTTQKFETSEGSRGTINLNGWLVDSTELFIKTRCRSNNPVIYKDTISKNTPWRLHQIQNAYNHLQFVEAELSSIINFSERYQPNYINQSSSSSNNNSNINLNGSTSSFLSSPNINNSGNNNETNSSTTPSSLWVNPSNTPNRLSINSNVSNTATINTQNLSNYNSNSNNGMVPELLSLFETVKSIGEWISMAKDELLLPSRDIFPHTLFQKNVFKNLPPDIHIDITITNCDIVFSLHELQISSTDSGQHLGNMQHLYNSGSGSVNSNNSPSKFLRKSTSNIKAVGGGSPHPQHMSQQLMSNGQINNSNNNNMNINGNMGNNNNSINNINNNINSNGNINNHQNGIQQNGLSSSTGGLSSSSSLSSSSNRNTINLGSSSNNLSSSTPGDLNSSSNNLSNSVSPNLGTLLESEEYNNTPDQLSKKTYQMNRLGNTQYVTIVDHSESRIPIKKLSDSFALMTSAYDKLADLSEKFMVLSNTS